MRSIGGRHRRAARSPWIYRIHTNHSIRMTRSEKEPEVSSQRHPPRVGLRTRMFVAQHRRIAGLAAAVFRSTRARAGTSPPGRARAARAAATGRVIFRVFRAVTAATKAHTVRFRLRSRKLYARVRAGSRYILEVTPGLSHARLGRSTRTVFRVR